VGRLTLHDMPVPVPDMTEIALASLPSAVDHPSHSSAFRLDPYWHGLWAWGSSAAWESRQLADRLAAAGVRDLNVRDARYDAETSRQRLTGHHGALASLGAVAMWRTLTSDQVSAFAGWVPPEVLDLDPGDATGPWSSMARWRDNPVALRLLWSAGMVERGTVNVKRNGLPYLYRTIRTNETDGFIRRLPFPTWLQVTAGQQWTEGPRHDRHNVLGAELALRIAEHCEVSTVMGESVCGHHLLDVSGRRTKASSDAADLVVVRDDGLRIVFETTAHRSGLERKISRWLDLLSETSFDESGTVVCFVEAAHPDGDMSGTTFNKLRRLLSAAIASRPEGVSRRLAERVAIVRWNWWFPSPLHVSPGFLTLEAHRPTGRGTDRWQPAHLLDVTDVEFRPPRPELHQAVIDNSAHLLGVPYWLRRDRHGFDIDRFMLEQAGLAGGPLDPAVRGLAAAPPLDGHR